MVRNLEGEKLDGWLAEAEVCSASAMRRYAASSKKNLIAVRAGQTETWSNGPGEGCHGGLKKASACTRHNDAVAGCRRRGLRQRNPARNPLLDKEAAMENTKRIERITADPDWYEPYKISLGTRVGNLLFVSGQAAVTQDGGETVGAGDFDAQAEQAFANLSKVLENGGSGLADVAKVSIYLTDMGNFPKIVELRERYFTPPYPADTIVEVSSLADPEWLIEIEAIAVVSE